MYVLKYCIKSISSNISLISNLLQLRDQLELVLFSIRIKLRASESRRENLSFEMLRNNVVARQCAVDVIVYREHFLRMKLPNNSIRHHLKLHIKIMLSKIRFIFYFPAHFNSMSCSEHLLSN